MYFDKPIDYKKRKQERKARKNAKRKKYQGIESEKCYSPDPKVPEALAKFLAKEFWWHIIKLSDRDMEKNLGICDYHKKQIALNEKLFYNNSNNFMSVEEVLLHELGHFVDFKIEGKLRGEDLINEAVAELFTYLVIGEGDIAEAEKVARDLYGPVSNPPHNTLKIQ